MLPTRTESAAGTRRLAVAAAIAVVAVASVVYSLNRNWPQARVQAPMSVRQIEIGAPAGNLGSAAAATRFEESRPALEGALARVIDSLPTRDAVADASSLHGTVADLLRVYITGDVEAFAGFLSGRGEGLPEFMAAMPPEDRTSYWAATTQSVRGMTLSPEGVRARARMVHGEAREVAGPDPLIVGRVVPLTSTDVYEIIVPVSIPDLTGASHDGEFTIWLGRSGDREPWHVHAVGVYGMPKGAPIALPPL